MSLRSGIQTKLFLLISALVAAITLVFTIGSWRWYGTTATRAVEQKALTYGQLVGRSAESAIAFDDHETAREAFDAVSVDPEVSAIALFREESAARAPSPVRRWSHRGRDHGAQSSSSFRRTR